MHQSSKFKIKIDFDKSRGAYIYDKNRKEYFLDFFGPYSISPLGYNHKIFKTATFKKEMLRVATTKVANCETISDEAADFLNVFTKLSGAEKFKHFHFCCTGALAIEAAIKTAIDAKPTDRPIVISLRHSFHGINSYGGTVTDRWTLANSRLTGMPRFDWPVIHNPKIIYRDNKIDFIATKKGIARFKKEFTACIKKFKSKNIVALLIEPVQSTAGDNYFPLEFFRLARQLCSRYNICLIFDEVQTGFGASGKMWYFQHTGIIPDIVAFGKKSQMSGIMVNKKFGRIFQAPVRLEVTWDGDLVDMLRCRYIMTAYKKFSLLENAKRRGEELLEGMKKVNGVLNSRGIGVLICFDFATKQGRDSFAKRAFELGLLFNATGTNSIRLRPPLTITSADVKKALNIIRHSTKP
ncbi:MAG: aminotransferase class III-fold pyridoxal phosphate-dependent enzyme [Parcubacteria group bacterium]